MTLTLKGVALEGIYSTIRFVNHTCIKKNVKAAIKILLINILYLPLVPAFQDNSKHLLLRQ